MKVCAMVAVFVWNMQSCDDYDNSSTALEEVRHK